MNSLYLIGSVQALFFSILILTKKNKILSDYVLAFFILLLGGQLFFVYSAYSELYTNYPWILLIDIYYWTLLGPTLLYYTKLMTTGIKFHWSYFIYLIPTLIVTIGYSNYIFVDGSSFLADYNKVGGLKLFTDYVWMYNSPVFYLITLYQLWKHPKRVKIYFASPKDVNLKWLYFLSSGFAFFLFVMLFRSSIESLIGIGIPRSYSYTWIVMVIYIFGIAFYGYKQRGVFASGSDSLPRESDDDKNIKMHILPELASIGGVKIPYSKSGLTSDEAEEISGRLIEIMEREKIYRECDITLGSLAKKLGTTNHKLSQVINENLGRNFFELINDYRIEEVKRRLTDPEYKQYKIISIAYECGFNTKSSFYTLFRKNTSLTPAEYRQNYQKKAV